MKELEVGVKSILLLWLQQGPKTQTTLSAEAPMHDGWQRAPGEELGPQRYINSVNGSPRVPGEAAKSNVQHTVRKEKREERKTFSWEAAAREEFL